MPPALSVDFHVYVGHRMKKKEIRTYVWYKVDPALHGRAPSYFLTHSA